MNFKAWCRVLLMLAALPVQAAARRDIVVESVQMPAWAEHASGAREPLAIGLALVNKDRIYTGPGSRAQLRLADGSLIKLGENGILALDDLGQKQARMKDLVTASLDVIGGAFRFTTQALYNYRGDRDVTVKIQTITAGIRGTDLWGKAEGSRDIVCLIEGSIAVARDKDAFTMDQPLSFYVAPRNEPPQPVGPVPRDQFAQWAQETEISADAGAMRKAGKWRVYLTDAQNQDDALAIYDRLRIAGYAAQIRPVKGEAGIIYRVRISNFATRKDAETFAAMLKGKLGITQSTVAK